MPVLSVPTFSPWPPSEYSGHWLPHQPCRAIDLDFRLPLALLRTREAALQRIRPHLRKRGLTEAGWRLLRTLESADRPLTPTVLARLMGGSDTNARIAAKRLMARGQVKWVEDPGPAHRTNDWRSGPWLALTQDGHGAIFRVRHQCRVHFIDDAPRLSATTRRALVRGLGEVIRACGASVPVALPPPPFEASDGDLPGWTAEAVHDLDLGLPLLMKHTRASLLGLVRPILTEWSLSEPQWRLMRLLDFWGSGVTQRGLIRSGCFLGPDARHALRALKTKGLMEEVRASAKVKRPKRFKLKLSSAGRKTIARIEDELYRRHAPAMARVSAGALAKLGPLIGSAEDAWLWEPGQDAPRGHPLDKEYARQEAAGRKWIAERAHQRERERDVIHFYDPATGRLRTMAREDVIKDNEMRPWWARYWREEATPG